MKIVTCAKVLVLESPNKECINEFGRLYDYDKIEMYKSEKHYHMNSELWHIEIMSCTIQIDSNVNI